MLRDVSMLIAQRWKPLRIWVCMTFHGVVAYEIKVWLESLMNVIEIVWKKNLLDFSFELIYSYPYLFKYIMFTFINKFTFALFVFVVWLWWFVVGTGTGSGDVASSNTAHDWSGHGCWRWNEILLSIYSCIFVCSKRTSLGLVYNIEVYCGCASKENFFGNVCLIYLCFVKP